MLSDITFEIMNW
uniref:Uncharacterized protein n=1 Tax=Arundo donax TaxID=35708 RepID=A0A0A8XU78_ARUDO